MFRYSEREEDFRCVFHTTGLMRTKMTPDATKLITATASGYLMVIHDLDLHTLAHDLQGFKPHLYHRMQMSQSMLNQENLHSHVFNRRRNRVELISDFPPENKAEMIASLEVRRRPFLGLTYFFINYSLSWMFIYLCGIPRHSTILPHCHINLWK